MEDQQLLWENSRAPQQSLAIVKHEPRQYTQQSRRLYGVEEDNYPCGNSGSSEFDCFPISKDRFARDPADADLLDIKIEELCYMTGENGEGFVFVEPKACDESGYETSNSAATSPYGCNGNNQTMDHDWIDSPSSVESLLSSCSEFCDYQTSASQQCPQLYINPPNTLTASSNSPPSLPALCRPTPPTPPPSDHLPETEPRLVATIECKPMMPTLLLYPSACQNSTSRYVEINCFLTAI